MGKRYILSLFLVLPALSGCDLHPKITSLPDSVGGFIETRYPALLADPETQPEIYNSAASDYGVFASPELYGSSTSEDYVLYASVDDYIVPPEQSESDAVVAEIVVNNESNTTENITSVDDAEPAVDDYLNIPKYNAPEKTNKKSDVVIVARGDTLYSIARRNDMTVDELALVNNIAAPYNLRIGQTLQLKAEKLPEPVQINVPEKKIVVKKAETQPATKTEKTKVEQKPEKQPVPVSKTNTTTRVDLNEIVIEPGDTLYSLSRRYLVPVNDLAVMNNMTAPFALYAGQKVKVPNLAKANVRAQQTIKQNVVEQKQSDIKKTEPIQQANKVKAVVETKIQKTTEAKTMYGKVAETKSKNTSKTENKKTEVKTPVAQPKVSPKKSDNKKTEQTKKTTVKQQTTAKEKISSDPAKKLPTIAARSSSKFSWPVRGKILSNFGTKPSGLVNDGINISAVRGTTVKAAENGVVAYAGNEVKGMGNLIIIQHSDGWMTVYAHLDSMNVRRGTKVSVGQKIGTVGSTGKVTEPQLHFEIRKGTKAYNPEKQLKK